MNLRLRKELRALLLPGATTLVAAVLMGVGQFLADSSRGELHGWWSNLVGLLCGLSPVTFIGGVVILAGSVFGMEFQHRTMPLWLSQGVSRAQLWKEKMLALAKVVTASSLVAVLSMLLGHSLT